MSRRILDVRSNVAAPALKKQMPDLVVLKAHDPTAAQCLLES